MIKEIRILVNISNAPINQHFEPRNTHILLVTEKGAKKIVNFYSTKKL